MKIVFPISISDMISFAAFLAVLWYAWEARMTAKEIEKQNRVQLAPFFIIDFAPNEKGQERLYIKNVGNGVAININYEVTDTKTDPKANIEIIFNGLFSLESKQRLEVDNNFYWADDPLNISLVKNHLTAADSIMELIIKIRFEDILGNKYIQEITANKNGIRPHNIMQI